MRIDTVKLEENKRNIVEKSVSFFVNLLKSGLPKELEEKVPKNIDEALWLDSSHQPVLLKAEEESYKKLEELLSNYILSRLDDECDGYFDLWTDYQPQDELAEILNECKLTQFNSHVPFKAHLMLRDRKVIYIQRSMKKEYVIYKWLKKDLYE